MRQRGLPRHVEAFVSTHLTSVAQLEILLLIQQRAGEPCSVAAVSEELRIDPGWARDEMHKLQRASILEADDADTFRFAPASDELRDAVADVAKSYKTHRVSVITAIFSTPSDSVGSFADAFKLRRNDDG